MLKQKNAARPRHVAPGTAEQIDSSTASRSTVAGRTESKKPSDQRATSQPAERPDEAAAPQAYVDQSAQYRERRQVSMLRASKAEHFKEHFGHAEMLQQGYLWDQDQPKEKKDTGAGAQAIQPRAAPRAPLAAHKDSLAAQGARRESLAKADAKPTEPGAADQYSGDEGDQDGAAKKRPATETPTGAQRRTPGAPQEQFLGHQQDKQRETGRRASSSRKASTSSLPSNYEYFRPGYEAGVDEVIRYLKEKKPQRGARGVAGVGASVAGALRRAGKAAMSAVGAGQHEEVQEVEQEVVQDGKKKYGWYEISASAACGDTLLLGFGNGALVCIDTAQSNSKTSNRAIDSTQAVSQQSTNEDLHLTGPENKPVDKLQIMYMESSSREARAGDKAQSAPTAAQVECLVVSLSGGTVNFHTWPDLDKREYLAEVAHVLDFEYYKKTKSARGSKSNQYFIAALFKSSGSQQNVVTATLKIFEFVTSGNRRGFEYVTKIPLQGPQMNPGQSHSPTFPIFDGGISVYQDIFLIQYRDSAEYIKINNMQQKSRQNSTQGAESVTRLQLWNDQVPSASRTKRRAPTQAGQQTVTEEEGKGDDDDHLDFGDGQVDGKTGRDLASGTVHGGRYDYLSVAGGQQFIAAKTTRKTDEVYACPVFDEFLQAFIVTRDYHSFYMDLNGVYDFEFRKIAWSSKVLKIQVASPYLVAFLQNSEIEVRNIFNPTMITQKIALDPCSFIQTCVAQNLRYRHQGRLDDFYVIFKRSENGQAGAPAESECSILKLKQDKAESQLSLWHGHQLYSTSLKFVDYLQDFNLKGVSKELYATILRQKAFYNFVQKKRYLVTKDIIKRYLVPMPQVIALFSFIFPEAYLHELQQVFPSHNKEVSTWTKQIKRIKIFQPLVANKASGIQVGLTNPQQAAPRFTAEDVEALRKKTSFMTIQELRLRKDPHISLITHYSSQVLDPASSQLSSDELSALKLFLPFFIGQRLYLQDRYLELATEDAKKSNSVLFEQAYDQNFHKNRILSLDEAKESQKQATYYSEYSKSDILTLLQFSEMIIFHSLILLLYAPDKADRKIYEEEFFRLLETDFEQEQYQINLALIEAAKLKSVQDGKDTPSQGAKNSVNQKGGDPQIYLRPVYGENLDEQEVPKMVATVRSQLPPFFCLDVFFKYRLYDLACRYLYYRREDTDLLQMIRWEYEANKQESEGLKKRIGKLQPASGQGAAADGNAASSLAQSNQSIRNLEAQRGVVRNLRNDWFSKQIEYMQKINDRSLCDHADVKVKAVLVAEAEAFCSNKSEWVLKENESRWVDCFKKSSNLESKMKSKEHECAQPPFMSDELLTKIQSKGNIRCSLKYLEYLTIKCNVKERRLHTELGCLYIQYIARLLKQFKKAEVDTAAKAPADADQENGETKPADTEEKPEEAAGAPEPKQAYPPLPYDLEAARGDALLSDLRNRLRIFLSTSNLYEPISILQFLKPHAGFMNKEHALLVMKLGRFKDCFDICINEVKDVQFALSVAKRGFEWHDKDRRIYYNLFTRLIESTNFTTEQERAENKSIAIKVLAQNCQHIPYEKITKNFDETEDLTSDLTGLFLKVFEMMDSNWKKSAILKHLTELEKHNQLYQRYEFLNQFILVSDSSSEQGQTLCSECGKPIAPNQPFIFNPESRTIIHQFHSEQN